MSPRSKGGGKQQRSLRTGEIFMLPTDANLTEAVPPATFDHVVRSPSQRGMGEDKQLLLAAAEAARDFSRPDPRIYWGDLAATAVVAYGALAGALLLPFRAVALALCIVSALAFYRALSFIHELTHIRRDRLPGFSAAWNVLIGIPLLTPGFMYDDVHTRHHAKTTYGTSRDPEYLPLASMGRGALVLFVCVSALAPLGLLFRFAVVAPFSLFGSALRKVVVERYSALAINPSFRRPPPTGAFRREWLIQEVAASVWAMAILVLVAAGLISLNSLLIALGIGSGVAVINQVRTLGAHLWDNESGDPMSLTAQYLDSVNVPPPATLPVLWAPVGLRYHALHHLLPSVPYHALGTVHRHLSLELGDRGTFRRADYHDLRSVIARIAARFSR